VLEKLAVCRQVPVADVIFAEDVAVVWNRSFAALERGRVARSLLRDTVEAKDDPMRLSFDLEF